ncbi:hypothetical protein AC249_AIPGENE23961 [Exaiptasia diaphana]|nr:hypothetical protein AC249_AIPGENE23961 [Exaiptasia diaphana]
MELMDCCVKVESHLKYHYSLCRIVQVSKCTHVSKEEADHLTKSITDNFSHDIAHYSRHGQLSYETGVYDLEHRSAQELFLRNERRMKLKEELLSQQGDWPDILNGIKDPMNCTFSQDYIYKGVAILDAEGNKCKLRTAKDVARIILAQARGWNRRYNQLKEQLIVKGFIPPFRSLKIESQLLIDDFVDNMIVKSAVAERCARIYADCNPRPDYNRMKQERRSSLVRFMNISRPVEELVKESPCWCAAQEYINCGTTTSLFGYKVSTVEATAELIYLKLYLNVRSNSKKRKATE